MSMLSIVKFSIPSPWNLDLFEELLKGYHDQQFSSLSVVWLAN